MARQTKKKHGDGWIRMGTEDDCIKYVNSKTGQWGMSAHADDERMIHVFDTLAEVDAYIATMRNSAGLITVYTYSMPDSWYGKPSKFIQFRPIQVRYYNQQWWYATGQPVESGKTLLSPTDQEIAAVEAARLEWEDAMKNAEAIYDRTIDMVASIAEAVPPSDSSR
jgi:ABC-type glycerol-3-phosphate transport system substrate-binding protein